MQFIGHARADLSLGAFVSQAAPVGMMCPHPECGEGAFVHLRNFMHGDSVVTLSCKRLADEEKLPGCARPVDPSSALDASLFFSPRF